MKTPTDPPLPISPSEGANKPQPGTTLAMKNKPWKRSTFNITTGKGKTEPRVGIIHPSGHFAIAAGQTRVTHLPSGILVSPYHDAKLPQVREFVERLTMLSFDWGTLTVENQASVGIEGVPIVRVILPICNEILGTSYPL